MIMYHKKKAYQICFLQKNEILHVNLNAEKERKTYVYFIQELTLFKEITVPLPIYIDIKL